MDDNSSLENIGMVLHIDGHDDRLMAYKGQCMFIVDDLNQRTTNGVFLPTTEVGVLSLLANLAKACGFDIVGINLAPTNPDEDVIEALAATSTDLHAGNIDGHEQLARLRGLGYDVVKKES